MKQRWTKPPLTQTEPRRPRRGFLSLAIKTRNNANLVQHHPEPGLRFQFALSVTPRGPLSEVYYEQPTRLGPGRV